MGQARRELSELQYEFANIPMRSLLPVPIGSLEFLE